MADAEVDTPSGQPLLVFVHIPKTAGTTLRTVLSMNEPGARSRALGNVFKGGGGISKTPIVRLRDGKGPDLTNVRLVRGHVPLGIREYLPQDRELRCFTFLREPVDRTLSHYFAIREAGRVYGLPPLTADATLDDAFEGGYLHDNLQTRMLSGQPEPFGQVDGECSSRPSTTSALGSPASGSRSASTNRSCSPSSGSVSARSSTIRTAG